MSEEFGNFAAAPQAPALEFGAPVEQAQEEKIQEIQAQTEAAEKEKKIPDPDEILTPAEKEQVKAFVKQIDLTNTSGILNYGVGTQKKLADFSQKAIDNVRTKDMGEVGNMLSGLVNELKDFDVAEDEKGFAAFFKRKANKVEALKTRYAKVEANVQTVSDELEKHHGIFQSGNRHSQNSGHGSWRRSGGMGRHQPSGRLRVGQPCGKKPGH